MPHREAARRRKVHAHHHLLAAGALVALAVLFAASGGVASADEDETPPHLAAACADLDGLDLPGGVEVTDTEATPAGLVATPGGAFEDLPALCRVTGEIPENINFEVWMPVEEEWTGRFQGVGNGGFAGSISYGAIASAVRDGFAAASTDTGTAGQLQSVWSDQLIEDFGHRAIHEMTTNAQSLVEEFYGEEADYSYFSGCSTGGRQGLMETQQYPDDYDGVIAGAPAIDMSSFQGAQIWAGQVTEEVERHFSDDELELITEAVLESCGDLDGLGDDFLHDPRRCDFDPESLECADGDDEECLTPEQVKALKTLYEGPRNDGEQVYPGFAMGSEYNWSGRIGASAPHFAGLATYRQLVHQDADWDWQEFDLGEDVSEARERFADNMDATDADLTDFEAQGGKLILWHGWNDPGIRAERSIEYLEAVESEMGERRTADFARLFLLPGVDHCGGGAGPDTFDGMAALIDWVERDEAPGRIDASDTDSGVSRPLCPYPEVARYTGRGSTDDAANFRCELRGLDQADETTDFDPGQHGRNNARRQQNR